MVLTGDWGGATNVVMNEHKIDEWVERATEESGHRYQEYEEWERSDGVKFKRARSVDRFGVRGEWSVTAMSNEYGVYS